MHGVVTVGIDVCSRAMMCLFFKQKTAYEMRISDWSSDVCSSDLADLAFRSSPERAEATGKITTETVEIRLVDNLPPGVVDLEVIERGGGRPPPEPDLQPETPSVDAPDLRLDIEVAMRSDEHTSELQSLMRNSYAVFCLKKKKNNH